MENNELLKEVTAKAQIWLDGNYDAETKSIVKAMLENEDKTDLIEAFYKDKNDKNCKLLPAVASNHTGNKLNPTKVITEGNTHFGHK